MTFYYHLNVLRIFKKFCMLFNLDAISFPVNLYETRVDSTYDSAILQKYLPNVDKLGLLWFSAPNYNDNGRQGLHLRNNFQIEIGVRQQRRFVLD